MRFKLTLAIIASFIAAAPAAADGPLSAQDPSARGFYMSVFGGSGSGPSADLTQFGTVFFTEAEGGPLAVNAKGRTDSGRVGFIGGQIGYEFAYGSVVRPAFEIEGLYLASGTRRATLSNPNDRILGHTFDNTYPIDSTVLLANMVFSVPISNTGLTPYFGGGIGAATVTINGANSLQTNPAEVGLNHFNSGTDSSAWTFAAQAKAGVRLALGRNAFVFGEYRYLYVGSTDQIFGPTVNIAHAPTTAWTNRFDATSYHLGTVGIGFNF